MVAANGWQDGGDGVTNPTLIFFWRLLSGSQRLQIGRLFGKLVVAAVFVVGNALLDLSHEIQAVHRQLSGQQFIENDLFA